MVVSDNGTELASRAVLQWQEDQGVEWHDIALGKPMQNGLIEGLNGRFRADKALGPGLVCRRNNLALLQFLGTFEAEICSYAAGQANRIAAEPP